MSMWESCHDPPRLRNYYMDPYSFPFSWFGLVSPNSWPGKVRLYSICLFVKDKESHKHHCFEKHPKTGAILMAAVGIGDGIAPIIGSYYGNIPYRFPFSSPKSLEGSFFGVFLGTIAGSHVFLTCLGLPFLRFQTVCVYAAIATVAEGMAPESLDNLFVPMLLHFSWDTVSSWKRF